MGIKMNQPQWGRRSLGLFSEEMEKEKKLRVCTGRSGLQASVSPPRESCVTPSQRCRPDCFKRGCWFHDSTIRTDAQDSRCSEWQPYGTGFSHTGCCNFTLLFHPLLTSFGFASFLAPLLAPTILKLVRLEGDGFVTVSICPSELGKSTALRL